MSQLFRFGVSGYIPPSPESAQPTVHHGCRTERTFRQDKTRQRTFTFFYGKYVAIKIFLSSETEKMLILL
jgi:hypothetical protein